MKSQILILEKNILLFWPVRQSIRLTTKAMKRLMWLWGRARFGALVQDRGMGCVCAWDADIKYPDNVHLGDRVIIGSNVSLGAHSPIHLKDNVRLSRDVIIETAGLDFSTGQPPYKHVSLPVTLEKGVWVGTRAIILGGVTIGENAVVAAGSIVTKPVMSGDVVAGVPAKVIKKFKRLNDE